MSLAQAADGFTTATSSSRSDLQQTQRGTMHDQKDPLDGAQSGPSLSDDPSIEAVPTLLKGAIDPVYEGKAQVLNTAIQDIGMGRYQWQLFVVVGGFGWASDNLWPIVTSLILPAIKSEFSPLKPPLLTLSQNIGLLVGAIFWGFGCGSFLRQLVPGC